MMNRRFTSAVLLCAALVALLVGASAASASPTFDYDPDIHAGVDIHVAGEGVVTGTPGDRTPNCREEQNGGGGCWIAYVKNSVVNLHADPDPGWLFAGWSGCTSESGSYCQIYVTEKPDSEYDNYAVQATFTPFNPVPTQHSLTVGVNGPGKVTGSGIDCPSVCSHSFIAGAWVTLQAQAQPLATFAGWSGACSGGPTSACVVKMDAALNVTATFIADVPIGGTRTLAVELTGTGSGTVSSGSAISCPGDCTQTYSVATDLTLTATAAAGSVFEGWSGACSGTSPTCDLTMSVSRTVGATFAVAPFTPGQPGIPGQPGTPGQPGNPDNPSPGDPANPPPGPGSPAGATCTITGTAGNDVLVGTPRSDVLCGLGGADRLLGKGADDVLVGGVGADVLDGGNGDDFLYGGPGKDRVLGRAGRDRLDAGIGADRLDGGRGTDRLLAGKGADLLLARDHVQDRLDGGSGRDRARLDRRLDLSRRVENVL
jgi:Divergent InlB B-repeat domain/RTX calcium-binding nonapeptide repeat (4 copies)